MDKKYKGWSQQNREQQYVAMKRVFERNNPSATPEQYQAYVAQLVKELGI
jgi:hypothetical protein